MWEYLLYDWHNMILVSWLEYLNSVSTMLSGGSKGMQFVTEEAIARQSITHT